MENKKKDNNLKAKQKNTNDFESSMLYKITNLVTAFQKLRRAYTNGTLPIVLPMMVFRPFEKIFDRLLKTKESETPKFDNKKFKMNINAEKVEIRNRSFNPENIMENTNPKDNSHTKNNKPERTRKLGHDEFNRPREPKKENSPQISTRMSRLEQNKALNRGMN